MFILFSLIFSNIIFSKDYHGDNHCVHCHYGDNKGEEEVAAWEECDAGCFRRSDDSAGEEAEGEDNVRILFHNLHDENRSAEDDSYLIHNGAHGTDAPRKAASGGGLLVWVVVADFVAVAKKTLRLSTRATLVRV